MLAERAWVWFLVLVKKTYVPPFSRPSPEFQGSKTCDRDYIGSVAALELALSILRGAGSQARARRHPRF